MDLLKKRLTQLRRAYKIIYRNGLTVARAMEELQKMECPEVNQLIKFIEASNAGIVR